MNRETNADLEPVERRHAANSGRILRRTFLTLFLRGRSARGLSKERAPKSVGAKLRSTLLVYLLLGLFAAFFLNQPVFTLSVYLHSMTFVFVGMFVAGSAGDVLFNREEADILWHRPISPRALLWAKIAVMVQVSLWMAAAFNMTGFLVGMWGDHGSWFYPLAHAFSTCWLAFFCTGTVVLVYQLCLRWFGRERLENMMTLAQVLISIAIILGSQAVPYLIGRFGQVMAPGVSPHAWWVYAVPPAWFAGLDDALTGSRNGQAWMLGGFGILVTILVLGLAFGKLSQSYASGMQALNEAQERAPRQRKRRRWAQRSMNRRWMRVLMKDSSARAAFLLTLAYLTRDRDVKLRVYPGLAPMLIIPVVFLARDISQEDSGGTLGFGVAFAGGYLGILPMMAINLVQYSQQWQAADIFRAAPLAGPGKLSLGVRWAILVFLALPIFGLLALMVMLVGQGTSHWPLLIPGILAVPIYAMIPCLGGKGVPLSLPIEDAKSASQGLTLVGCMIISMMLSGLALVAWKWEVFSWFLLVEAGVVLVTCLWLRQSIDRAGWKGIPD